MSLELNQHKDPVIMRELDEVKEDIFALKDSAEKYKLFKEVTEFETKYDDWLKKTQGSEKGDEFSKYLKDLSSSVAKISDKQKLTVDVDNPYVGFDEVKDSSILRSPDSNKGFFGKFFSNIFSSSSKKINKSSTDIENKPEAGSPGSPGS